MSKANKASKEEANYRKGREDYECDLCSMWRGSGFTKSGFDTSPEEGACTAVKGTIWSNKVCDYFDPE